MNPCHHAETLRLLLFMGMCSRSDVIAWADDLIATQDDLPPWLLDLSLAANETDHEIEARLRNLPCEADRASAAYDAIDRFAEAFRAGHITPQAGAHLLSRWATTARVNPDDDQAASAPGWIADEVEHGQATDQDVLESISACLAHFAAARRARKPSPAAPTPVHDLQALWRNGPAGAKDNFIENIARPLGKTGSLAESDAELRSLAEFFTPTDAVFLYERLRDASGRLEFEWRDEFLRHFPAAADSLPPVLMTREEYEANPPPPFTPDDDDIPE